MIRIRQLCVRDGPPRITTASWSWVQAKPTKPLLFRCEPRRNPVADGLATVSDVLLRHPPRIDGQYRVAVQLTSSSSTVDGNFLGPFGMLSQEQGGPCLLCASPTGRHSNTEIAARASLMDPRSGHPVGAGNSIWTAHPRPLVAGGKSPLRAGVISTEKRSSRLSI